MNLTEHAQVNACLYQFGQTYLEKRGWFESLDGIPRNKDGVVPWITYPAFRQLQRVIKPGFKVFEYGCGGSSLWWAAHAAEVTSVEHDAAWADRVAKSAPANLKIITREMGAICPENRRTAVAKFFADAPALPVSKSREHNIMHGLLCEEFLAYATEITEFERASFDVVVVDGMARALTAWLAAQYVKPGGIIVFDNTDRWQYNAAYQMLSDAEFRRIDYYGPGPVNRLEWCTSLFVRDLAVFQQSVDSPQGDCDLGW
jgi:SAM-dependent methyltransferase